MEQDMWIDEWIAAESDPRAVMKDRAIGAGLIARAPSTAPTRRIRRAQNSVPAGLAALDLREARALLRYKDLMLRAVARAGDDAMLAADALRMERDAAHEECARLRLDGGITLLEALGKASLARADASRYMSMYGAALIVLTEYATVSARLVRVICKDAERIATLTAERDHARAIAVALEQGAASAFDEVLARWEAVTAQIAAGVWSYMGAIEPGSVDPELGAEQAGLAFALRTLARVPMDSDRTPEVER